MISLFSLTIFRYLNKTLYINLITQSNCIFCNSFNRFLFSVIILCCSDNLLLRTSVSFLIAQCFARSYLWFAFKEEATPHSVILHANIFLQLIYVTLFMRDKIRIWKLIFAFFNFCPYWPIFYEFLLIKLLYYHIFTVVALVM